MGESNGHGPGYRRGVVGFCPDGRPCTCPEVTCTVTEVCGECVEVCDRLFRERFGSVEQTAQQIVDDVVPRVMADVMRGGCPPEMACSSLGVRRTRLRWALLLVAWGWVFGSAPRWVPVLWQAVT